MEEKIKKNLGLTEKGWEDLIKFLWKVGNDYNKTYPSELVDEARDLFLKYNKKLRKQQRR